MMLVGTGKCDWFNCNENQVTSVKQTSDFIRMSRWSVTRKWVAVVGGRSAEASNVMITVLM